MASTRFIRSALLCFLALIATGISAAAAAPPDDPPGRPASSSRPLVIRLKPGADASSLAAAFAANGVSIDKAAGRGGMLRLAAPANANLPAILAALRGNAAIAEAGYDLTVTAFDAPNDPAYPQQWALQTSSAGIGVEGAWALSPSRGAGVVVAVIDTGVAYEDASGGQGLFGPKIFKRAPDLANVPIVAPWDWIGGDSHANDENGHGTHVSGTILEGTNNGLSAAGISAASLMPLRILDFAGSGQGSDLVDALYYAADHGANVINLSLGFPNTGTPDADGEVCSEVIGLAAALQYVDAMGVTVVAASGNEGAGTVSCPAAYPTVISVGATKSDGAVASYSNRGSELDLSAPGGDPTGDQVVQETYCADVFTLFLTGQYTLFCDIGFSGTSMATPHVAGTVALLKAQHPSLSPAQIRDVLEGTARDRGAPGWDGEYGHGVIDATAAMASIIANPPPPPPPGPPPIPRPVPQPGATGLTAAALSTTSIRLNWTDAATGESGFRIDRSADGGASWTQAGTAAANAVAYTSSGLAPETAYLFRVRSYDSIGNSTPWSEPAAGTTLPLPSAPTDPAALALTATSVRVSWVDTSTSEQGFKVERSTDGGATFSGTTYASKDATGVTVNSLTPNTTYSFRVRAYDGTQNGEPSPTVSATTFPLPAPPSGLTAATVSSTSIRLDWTDNSSTEQGFRIERSTDGLTWAQAGLAAANAVTWTNNSLAPDTTYFYRARGYDGLLNGDPSNVATASTLDAPPAPVNLTATPTSTTKIRLDWTDVSSYEQGFKIERSADGGATWIQAATTSANVVSYTISNLAPGTSYSLRVRAYQGSVNGDYSEVAVAATFDPPSAPTNFTGTPLGSTSLRLNWTNSSPIQSGIKIERSLDGVNWAQVASLPATTVTWTNSQLLPGTAYTYRIRVVEGSTSGPFSDPIVVSTLGPASAPADVSVTLQSSNSVKLTWTDTCTYESGFRVERSLDGITWTQVAQVGANSTSWTNFWLAAHTTYYYRVRAYDSTTNGEYSAVVTITTP